MTSLADQPAIVLHELGQSPRLERVAVSAPGENEVLVRIMASGVCHTDLGYKYYARATPVLLGHEGAGIVVAAGKSVTAPAVGDHVVINWQAKCGTCRNCMAERPQFCEQILCTDGPRIRLGTEPLAVMLNAGTFCPYAVVPAKGSISVRKDIPFAIAALMGCAVATGIGAALNSAKVQLGDDIVVIGCGGVGLNTIQGARIAGARRIVAIDRDTAKLELARTFGATHCIDASAEDAVHAVRAITGERGGDHVFEVVGCTDIMESALQMLARGGRLTLVGAAGREDVLSFKPRNFMSQQQTICGCIYGDIHPEQDLPQFADWYAEGSLLLDPMHTQTITLTDVPAMFETGYRPAGIRTVIDMSEPA